MIIVSRLILSLLTFYKRFISPLLGARCRFHPSCSDYARVAVARFGSVKGSWLAANRLLRCQPLCEGGCDPVPMSFSWRPFLREKPVPEDEHE
ncbi:MAG TPA: membrane protein insertion efficiency factor YidD [Dokdonella sp.]|nr:membrane protein insertion efficiency factor YidD [Dokdonella sp.]HET9034365.1 membrane protein insertion efficiency factor YidD [Dokdonella sp.]